MEIGKINYGFELLEEKKIEEIDSIGRLFIHKKSGLIHEFGTPQTSKKRKVDNPLFLKKSSCAFVIVI